MRFEANLSSRSISEEHYKAAATFVKTGGTESGAVPARMASQAVVDNEKTPEKLSNPSESEAVKRRGQDLNLR